MPDEDRTDPTDDAAGDESADAKADDTISPRRPLGTTDWAILYAGE